jgi:hypothetical protein
MNRAIIPFLPQCYGRLIAKAVPRIHLLIIVSILKSAVIEAYRWPSIVICGKDNIEKRINGVFIIILAVSGLLETKIQDLPHLTDLF